MKKGLSVLILSALVMMGGWGGSSAAEDKVVFILDWLFYGEHVPWFAAKDLGFFKKEGLDVTLQRGFGSGDTIKRIAAKAAPFGEADVGSLIIARSQGAKVKEIAMYYAKTPMAILFLNTKGYKTPRDLVGAKMGGPEGNAAWKVFPAFANANGLDPKQVMWTTLDYGALSAALLTGKLDAFPFFYDEEPSYQAKAREQGKDTRTFRYSEWGVDIYANGLITHDDVIKTNPGLVRRFVKAAIESEAHCLLYVDRCLQNFLKYAPTMQPENVRQQYIRTREMNIDKGVLEHGLGYMVREKMDRTIDIITKYTPLKVRVKTEDVYTNEFLPQVAGK